MQADFRVCIDACVLANYAVSDLLFRLAEKPRIYTPVLSCSILDEVRRTHVEKLAWGEEIADSWQRAVRGAFPDTIAHEVESMIPCMTNSEKDRHVVAAAIMGKAQLILTFNLRDFGSEHLERWNLEAQHPQDYLITLYEMRPDVMVSRLYEAANKHHQTPQERLAKLATALPRFSDMMVREMYWEIDGPSSK